MAVGGAGAYAARLLGLPEDGAMPTTGDFEWAYITNDLERAIAGIEKALDVEEMLRTSMTIPYDTVDGSGTADFEVAFATVGGSRSIELLLVDERSPAMYQPAGGGHSEYFTHFHHIGLWVEPGALPGLRLELQQRGRDYAMWGDVYGVAFAFVDLVPELGHHIELMESSSAALEFVDNLLVTSRRAAV
jgi:hypothetical protein